MLGGTAYAMASGQGQGGQQSPVSFFIFMGLLFAVFYFLLIRPQQKKQKEHRRLLESLKKGDKVVTNGGIHGTIVSLSATLITMEIADKVKVKVDRNCVVGLAKSE